MSLKKRAGCFFRRIRFFCKTYIKIYRPCPQWNQNKMVAITVLLPYKYTGDRRNTSRLYPVTRRPVFYQVQFAAESCAVIPHLGKLPLVKNSNHCLASRFVPRAVRTSNLLTACSFRGGLSTPCRALFLWSRPLGFSLWAGV